MDSVNTTEPEAAPQAAIIMYDGRIVFGNNEAKFSGTVEEALAIGRADKQMLDLRAKTPSMFNMFATAVGTIVIAADFHVELEPPPTKDKLLAWAARRRFEAETAGITVDGIDVATDRQSQALIIGAHLHLAAGGKTPIAFKARSGFVSLDAARVEALAFAVSAHVEACFAKEAEIVARIVSGQIKRYEEVDAEAWPPKSAETKAPPASSSRRDKRAVAVPPAAAEAPAKSQEGADIDTIPAEQEEEEPEIEVTETRL